MRGRLGLLAALWVGCGLMGYGQSVGTPTLRISARIVVLDVSATDAQGLAVTDLTAKDFRVYEDKDVQTIRSFEPPSAHRMITPGREGVEGATIVRSSADLTKIGQAPITILVLDELNMPFGEEVYARDLVAKWLKAQPAVLAQPTMLVAITYKDLHVLVDTTQDRDTMAEVLRKHYATTPWRSYNAGSVGGTAGDILAATLGSLEQIAHAMRGLPGRKNVIWVGDGFPPVQPTDVTVNTADMVRARLRRLSGLMLQSRIVLSILGPTVKPPNRPTNIETFGDSLGGALTADGLGGSGTIAVGGIGQSRAVPLGGNLNFSELAAPTGGKAYRGRNDLDKELAETISAGTVYYTMTYTPTNSSEAEQQYRKIRVDVLRPGLTLRSRDGYYPQPSRDPGTPAAMPSKQQLAFDLYGAANSTLSYTGLYVVPARADATHWTLQVRAAEMDWDEKPGGGGLEAKSIVLAVCFDRSGHMIGRTFDAIGSDTASTETQLLGRTTELHVGVPVPAGTARIRFVVRDSNSGRVGTADATP